MNSQIESRLVLLALSLVVLASCASPIDAPYVCLDGAGPRHFDCESTQGPNWQLLPAQPGNWDHILRIAKAIVQSSIDRGDDISVPSQAEIETIGSRSEVKWFESDDGSLMACIRGEPVGTATSHLIYKFPKENGDWTTPSVVRVVNLCNQ